VVIDDLLLAASRLALPKQFCSELIELRCILNKAEELHGDKAWRACRALSMKLVERGAVVERPFRCCCRRHWILEGSFASRYTWNGSANGWMTSTIFADIIRHIFIPEIERRRAEREALRGRRALLLIDGATSHGTPEARDMLEKAGIDLVMLLPNSTHILQPLDACIFGPFKQHLNKNLTAMRSSLRADERRDFSTVPARRAALLEAAVDAMDKAATWKPIRDAFRLTGIFPVNVEEPLKNRTLVETQHLAEEQQKKKKKKLKRSGIPIAGSHGVVSIAELAQGRPKKKQKQKLEPGVAVDVPMANVPWMRLPQASALLARTLLRAR
jgi:hypothetical protein